MPTTVTHSIGSNYPVGRDYPDPQTWVTAMVTLYPNLVSSDVVLVGQWYNDSEISLTGTYGVNITGFTTDATHTITLQAAAGQGINSGGATLSPLNYDTANGACMKSGAAYQVMINIGQDYTTIQGIQLNGAPGGGHNGEGIHMVGAHTRVDQCLIIGGTGPPVTVNASSYASGYVTRNLLISGGYGIYCGYPQNLYIIGNSIVAPSDATSGAQAIHDGGNSSNLTATDNACFGFASVFNDGSGWTVSNTATDLSSCPGSNNQTSLTYTAQFVNTTNASGDYRSKTGSTLRGNGVANSTYNAQDIVGQTRNATPDIGAWEYVAAGSAVGTIALNIAVAGTGSSQATSVGSIGLNIAVAGVGAENAASVGTIGLAIGVAGVGAETAASVGAIGLNIGVSGVGAETAASVGTIGIAIGVAGVGVGTSPGSAVGTIGLNIDVEGVGASASASIGTVGLDIAVAGASPQNLIIIDTHDDWKKKKRWDDEAAAKKRRKAEILDAYERIVEDRPEVARAIAAPFLPKKAKFLRGPYELPKQALFTMVADPEAARRIWEEFLDMEDEEILRLL